MRFCPVHVSPLFLPCPSRATSQITVQGGNPMAADGDDGSSRFSYQGGPFFVACRDGVSLLRFHNGIMKQLDTEGVTL